MSPTPQDLSNDTTFSPIKSRVPVPLSRDKKGTRKEWKGKGLENSRKGSHVMQCLEWDRKRVKGGKG